MNNASDWEKIFSIASERFHHNTPKCPFQEVPHDIWVTLICFMGSAPQGENWLQSKVPALNNKRPIDIMKTLGGIAQIKRLILRLPW